ncbi:MAG: hypothetical protein IVW54_15385 [Candidatus Binataceae bacterium]|nr:hypothetical protein [Candidatus Binataceae bacterium]
MQFAELAMLLVFWIIAMAIVAEVKTSSGNLPRMLWPMLGLVTMMLTVMLFEMVKRSNSASNRQSRETVRGGVSSNLT